MPRKPVISCGAAIPVTLRMGTEFIAVLDTLSRLHGTSRSELMRRGIEEWVSTKMSGEGGDVS